MKKTLATIATALIMISSMSSFAANKTNPIRSEASAAVLTSYLKATTLGGTSANTYLFAEDFEYSNAANGDRFTKKEYSNFLEAHKGIQFDCETTYEILDESGDTAIAKVSMKFDNFTRIDYVTLSQSKDGWKVSKVVTGYSKI